MRWNWQLPDWPNFCFDAERIRASEEQFVKGSGVVIGPMHHLDADARDGLTIELISQEIVDSSAIEGEILDRASVQSSLARHLGFAADQVLAEIARLLAGGELQSVREVKQARTLASLRAVA